MMKYVFNPRNRQINPVTEMTAADPSLRDKVVSAELYALVCKGKVSIEDVAALFAVGKSPEVLVKNVRTVKDSPVATAPVNDARLEPAVEQKPAESPEAGEPQRATADSAFAKGDLWKKSQADLMIIAGTLGIDTASESFQPTRRNLVEAILARAQAAEGK